LQLQLKHTKGNEDEGVFWIFGPRRKHAIKESDLDIISDCLIQWLASSLMNGEQEKKNKDIETALSEFLKGSKNNSLSPQWLWNRSKKKIQRSLCYQKKKGLS
jgi:hypothetical protein